jgi:Zn-dependent protease
MPEQIALGLAWYLVFLLSTTLHEAAHALAARQLGDPTAYHGGQVTLNPIPHIRREPFGTILVPLISFVLAGWMVGWASAPYDPIWARRYPKRAAWMAVAGPASNLLLVLAAAGLIRGGLAAGWFYPPERLTFARVTEATAAGAISGLAVLVSVLFTLNLVLLVFNLLPLPPLDGSGALPLFMSRRAAERYQELVRQPAVSLLGLVIAWKLFGAVFGPVLGLAIRLLYPGLAYQ